MNRHGKRTVENAYAGGPLVKKPSNFSAKIREALNRKGWNQTQAAAFVACDYRGNQMPIVSFSRYCQAHADESKIGFEALRNIELALDLPVSHPNMHCERDPETGACRLVSSSARNTPRASDILESDKPKKDRTSKTEQAIRQHEFEEALSTTGDLGRTSRVHSRQAIRRHAHSTNRTGSFFAKAELPEYTPEFEEALSDAGDLLDLLGDFLDLLDLVKETIPNPRIRELFARLLTQ
tara:strand:- start:198 stop:908 length:711 start_codon:yes stop_codon:yes gene_type:complete